MTHTTTATTTPERWLEKMPEGSIRESLAGLRRLTRCVIAADGVVLIAERSDRTDVPELHTDAPLEWLKPKGGPIGRYAVRALREWAGEPQWPARGPVECWECDGKGVVSHSCDCEYCDTLDEGECEECGGEGDEEGVVNPPMRPTRVFGKVFDANRIAQVASALPDDGVVTIHVQPLSQGHALLGVTGEVRFLVMSMHESGVPATPAPPTPIAEVG